MKFGFHMFTRGATVTPDAIAGAALHCESLDFDYFGVGDHVVVSAAIDLPILIPMDHGQVPRKENAWRR